MGLCEKKFMYFVDYRFNMSDKQLIKKLSIVVGVEYYYFLILSFCCVKYFICVN